MNCCPCCTEINIEDLRKGNEDAWHRAYDYLFARGLKACLIHASDFNHQEQEDVIEEAIVKAFNSLETVKDFEQLKRRVYALAIYRSNDYRDWKNAKKRGAGKLESLAAQPEDFEAPDEKQTPDDAEPTDDQVAVDLNDALEKINKKYALVVTSYVCKGLSFKEIAEQQGLKPGSVGVYKDRGLEMLKRLLSGKYQCKK